MKLVRCNGEIRHYYDGDVYSECPECLRMKQSGVKPSAPQHTVIRRERTGGETLSLEEINRRAAQQPAVQPQIPAEPEMPVPEVPVQGIPVPPRPVPAAMPVPEPPVQSAEPQKHGGLMHRLFGKKENAAPVPPVPPAPPAPPAPAAPVMPAPPQMQQPVMPEPAPQPVPEPAAPAVPEQEAPAAGSLASAVAAVQKTNPAGSGKTVAFYRFSGSEPVVGWLVSVKGCGKGEGYALKAGQNFIGRSLAMDIVLKDDPAVSREHHAAVMFEPKQGTFYLMPGQSTGITYLNDAPLLAPTALSAYDKIGVGDTLLIFVPFCGEQFRWEDYPDSTDAS